MLVNSLKRLVSQINPAVEDNDSEKRAFDSYKHASCLILLGDPGAGKTKLFNQSNEQEHSSICISPKGFLTRPTTHLAQFDCIFIDGIDEQRAKSGDQDILDQIVSKLWELQPKKIRLSCRSADWHNELDIEELNAYLASISSSESSITLRLEALTESEAIEILNAKGINNPDEFIKEAQARSISDFLKNPQTLLMLAEAVKNNQWPKTKKELFDKATSVLLQEHNDIHIKESTIGSANDRSLCAGAICAARLLSDVDAIILNESQSQIASNYKLISGAIGFFDHALISSVLHSRAFTANSDQEFDYSHRMTAEYLAAQWVAVQIENGLPFSRLLALICIDGKPVSELRAFYAWLTIFLPSHFEQLLALDPQTVLIYADISSFTPNQKKQLLFNLKLLSKENPWFNSTSWWSLNLSALSCLDLQETILEILNDNDTEFHLKAVVYTALEQGDPLPQVKHFLKANILTSIGSSEADFAVRAFIHQSYDTKDELLDVYHLLGKTNDDIQLRIEFLHSIYKTHLTPKDFASLLIDAIDSAEERVISGSFWELEKLVSIKDIPQIINNVTLNPSSEDPCNIKSLAWDAFRILNKLLTRYIMEESNLNYQNLWNWLVFLHSHPEFQDNSHRSDLIGAISARKADIINGLAPIYFQFFLSEQNTLTTLYFTKVLQDGIRSGELLSNAIGTFSNIVETDKDYIPMYDLCLRLSLQVETSEEFWQLYSLAETHSELLEMRRIRCFEDVESTVRWNFESAERQNEYKNKQADILAQRRRDFLENKHEIEKGEQLHWLGEAAMHYWGRYSDDIEDSTPNERLTSIFGAEGEQVAITGLVALAKKQPDIDITSAHSDFPTIRVYHWWWAVSAGLNELFKHGHPVSEFNDSFLQNVLQADFLRNFTFQIKGVLLEEWRNVILKEKPELLVEAICLFAEHRLSQKIEGLFGEYDFFKIKELSPFFSSYIDRALTAYLQSNILPSTHLLSLALKHLSTERVQHFIDEVLSGTDSKPNTTHPIYQALQFNVLDDLQEIEINTPTEAKELVWFFSDFLNQAPYSEHLFEQKNCIKKLKTLITFIAKAFPEWKSRSSTGDQNDWGASECLLSLTNKVASTLTDEAQNTLKELIKEPALQPYSKHLKHKLFEQQALIRDSQYQVPSPQQVINTLQNNAPTNNADLHALVVDSLAGIQKSIQGSNEDLYRQFWNEPKGKPETPKWEESCRDALLPLLRGKLQHLNIHVEPEGHMVNDKRADIVILYQELKTVIELKRDFHKDLWTAVDTQLDRLYTRDPSTDGYGIYGVFWYGNTRTDFPKITAHPDGIEHPTTPQELKELLENRLNKDQRRRISVIVIDVSVP